MQPTNVEAVETVLKNQDQACLDWQLFYQEVLGLNVDFSGIRIPPGNPEFDLLAIMAEGTTLDRVYSAFEVRGLAYSRLPQNMKQAIKHDRDPANGSYAFWMRSSQESVDFLTSMSADDLWSKQIKTVTLLEYKLIELYRFVRQDGIHLDERGYVLCAGSSFQNGTIPDSRWHGDKSQEHCVLPKERYGFLAAREVIVC